jgi:hypothetical protein
MVFFELRWNYSPLKEKAVLLPDGLFASLCRKASLCSTPLYIFARVERIYAPDASRSARGRPRGVNDGGQNLSSSCTSLHTALHFSRRYVCSAPEAGRLGAQVGLAASMIVDKICR